MHPNNILLQRLFTALDQRDPHTMASCYRPNAEFRDIAFHLHGKQRIHEMWGMICEGSDIRATFEVIHADDQDGRVKLVDTYTFSDTQRPVRNIIDSRFYFQDGLIVKHRDFCDAHAWGAMALGGLSGFLAGRIRLLRSWKANKMLKKFVQAHPEYR